MQINQCHNVPDHRTAGVDDSFQSRPTTRPRFNTLLSRVCMIHPARLKFAFEQFEPDNASRNRAAEVDAASREHVSCGSAFMPLLSRVNDIKQGTCGKPSEIVGRPGARS